LRISNDHALDDNRSIAPEIAKQILERLGLLINDGQIIQPMTVKELFQVYCEAKRQEDHPQ